jgi:two-component system sensor histidine kinase/response regulator
VTYTWLSVTFSVVNRNADAGSLRLLGIFQDINERKRLEEHLRRTTERLELGVRGSGTVVFDLEMPEVDIPVALGAPAHEGPRSTLNLIGWENLGYSAPPSFNDADRIGAMLHHPEDGLRAHEVTAAYLRGETPKLETEFRIRHADGSYSWRLARGEALRRSDGRPTRLIGSLVDITDLKRIETELHTARLAAELANRAKDEFLANVSHEIRTPMNAILGMTELALDASETAHQRQLLSTVKAAARNLLHVINDLLDFSKITAGKLALDHDDFSLRSAIGDTLRALTVRAHRKGLELVCDVHDDVPDLLFGDAGRVRQVLMNLIGNAIKFTARGEVVLTVGLDPEAAGAAPAGDDGVPLRFTVRDTGIGIAPEKHAAIFRAFEQEDASTTRRFGGTGLGLTISAQLATLMGGRITVESEPGRGSTFAFVARISRSAKPDWPGLSSPGLLEGLSVLVVDDNETNRHILTEWLSHWRMRPTAAGDAAATIAALESAHQSATPLPLVLLDSRMPDTDGITLARQIRERFGPAAHRFILLSSDHSAGLPARARDAGIHAYLLKPVQQSELLETISAVMSAVELDDDMTAAVPPDPARRERSLHILVAEDNELNVALLRELLDQRGHRIEVAGDGRTALALATRGSVAYDVMLLDLHLPELDGFEVARGIREHERGRGVHLPVIALTARSTKRDREAALAAGMDDFLSKPIEVTALWNAIDRATADAPPLRRSPVLLDARAIRQMTGGRQTVLDRLCEVLRRTVPEQMGAIKDALDHRDFARLRVAAHRLAGTVAGFSSMVASLASSLEDAAADEDLIQSTSLAGHIEAAGAALLEETLGLTLDSLGR